MKQEKDPGKPPLFNSWTQWYIVVLGSLVVLIILFSLFTKKFS